MMVHHVYLFIKGETYIKTQRTNESLYKSLKVPEQLETLKTKGGSATDNI